MRLTEYKGFMQAMYRFNKNQQGELLSHVNKLFDIYHEYQKMKANLYVYAMNEIQKETIDNEIDYENTKQRALVQVNEAKMNIDRVINKDENLEVYWESPITNFHVLRSTKIATFFFGNLNISDIIDPGQTPVLHKNVETK